MPRRIHLVFLIALFLNAPFVAAQDAPSSIRIATWNLEWFYDHDTSDNKTDLSKKLSAPSETEWHWRVKVTAEAIAKLNPTILALQEIENEKVLNDLRKELRTKHDLEFQVAFIQGRDTYTEQDVGYLYRGELVDLSRKSQTKEMYDSKKYYNLSKHAFATFRWQKGDKSTSVTLLNVHLRASERGADARSRQCQLIQHWIRPMLKEGQNVIVLGDINTSVPCGKTSPGSDAGVICNLASSLGQLVLFDLHAKIAAEDRATHLTGRQFDRIFISKTLMFDSRQQFNPSFKSIENRKDLCVRNMPDKDHYDIYFKIPQEERDISDHYPVVVTFDLK
tara:strand:- start:1552 stop:2556 length:1005 start_codon:yes stop_codon:yes gene_type:complete